MTSIVVVSAGTGTPSSSRLLGERISDAVVIALAEANTQAEVTHIELRTIAVELAQHLTTRVPGANLRRALAAARAADGLVVVSPVMNGSYSGLFKLFFDALEEDALRGHPVLLAASGGTARHSLMIDQAMLPLFFYLKALVAPLSVFAATKDWGTAGGKLERRIASAAQAFATLVLSADPIETTDELTVTDFSELLGG